MVQGINRRKYPRAHFTIQDKVFAVFELPGPANVSMSTYILSLSEGGISLIGSQDAMAGLKTGDKLTLVKVLEPEELQILRNIRLQVRHTISELDMEHTLSGCCFLNATKEQKTVVATFVDKWLNR